VLALFETGLQVLLLLLALLRGQDFVGGSGPVRLGVRICHSDVNNDIRPTGPEATSLERDKRWTAGTWAQQCVWNGSSV
jgi:hypothetical protein